MNISDDIIRAIRPESGKGKAGWIFPNGEVKPCAFMDHVSNLPSEYQERYKEILAHEYEEMNEALDALEPDEHPAMHRFDPEYFANKNLMEELSDAKYIRFGIWSHNNVLRFEVDCSKRTIDFHRETILYLMAGVGSEVLYNDTKKVKL